MTPAHARRNDSAAPLHIASLAAVVWNFPLVGRTRMLAEAWQAAGQPHTFVQVPSYRSAVERATGWFRAADSVSVVRPWPASLPARFWKAQDAGALEAKFRRAARQLRRQLDRIVDWDSAAALVVSPVWTPWLSELPFGRIIYDYIDELDVHVAQPDLKPLYQRWEDELLERCHAVVATAEDLAEDARRRRPGIATAVIRNGVDVERFERGAAQPRPHDLPPADRKIIGFVGALYRWIEWRLIRACVEALPAARFVFVGPDDGNPAVAELAQRDNVEFLGARPYADVPAYMAAFDVCWVPFTQDHISKAANPVKVYEYLALGKPTVSTPVADTTHFENLIQVGATADEIIAALQAALVDADPAAEARRNFARRNTWSARAAEYVEFLTGIPKAPRL